MYTMGRLCKADSERLFWENALVKPREPSQALKGGSESIFAKCGGLPRALVSTASYLRERRQDPDATLCKRVGEELGAYLSGNKSAFREMNRAFVHCYESLPDYGHRRFLLSLSIFPRDHKINSKSLIRSLLAEGLIDGDGYECLEELMDRCILEPVLVRKDSKVVERCQVQSVMLEFTIQQSVSRNYVTLIHNDKPQHHNQNTTIRRLTVQSQSTKVGCHEVVKGHRNRLSAVRSLTIFNSEILDLESCKVLRVLDLEGCRGLDNKVLLHICRFKFLKYLSLRNTDVYKVPREIMNLKRLETLDTRGTEVKTLPMEAILLPCLLHLFGRFELPRPEPRDLSILSNKSKLLTLAGVEINRAQGFKDVILHARSLRKVKAWLGDGQDPGVTGALASSLLDRGFTQLESVSIDSSDLSKAFLASLNAPCLISSIKLRGKLKSIPDATRLGQLSNLNKLHLYAAGLSSEDLSVLQSLTGLEYLKLAEDGQQFWDGRFDVWTGGFESLQWLCFEAPKLPRVRIMEKGAMPKLTSLHLLCREFADGLLGVTGIQHLEDLDDVILHPSVGDSKLKAWKEEAINNSNRPHVKKQEIRECK